MTVDQTAEVLKDAAKGFNAEPEPELAKLAGPGLLKTTEGFLLVSPNNEVLLTINAESFCGYGFAFVEDELEQIDDEDPRWEKMRGMATSLYSRCEGFGRRLLKLHDDEVFPAALDGSLDKLKAALAKIEQDKDEDAVPGLFWTGLGLGSRINVNRDDITAIGSLQKVVAIMETVAKLDPKYYNGGANLTLGLILSAQGKAMGGNPEMGRQKLEEAIKATDGKFLMVKVMMAHVWAVTAQDKAAFTKILNEVIAAPDDLWPAEQLANTIAKRKAARYLKTDAEKF
jgi:hypothetical protein